MLPSIYLNSTFTNLVAFLPPHRELSRTLFGGAAQPSFAFVATPEALTAVPVGAERPSLRGRLTLRLSVLLPASRLPRRERVPSMFPSIRADNRRFPQSQALQSLRPRRSLLSTRQLVPIRAYRR